MRTEEVNFDDQAVEVMPPAIHQHGDDVAEVTTGQDYTLHVSFFDGLTGEVQMREMIFSEDAGVFAALRDENTFRSVGISFGAVTWTNGLDLAPDAMHDEIERNGIWVLR